MSDEGDKRSVATDALATLGTIIGPKEKRDAIHLAVIPAIAGAPMQAGTHVIIRTDGKAWPVKPGKGVGIVDPFLTVDRSEQSWYGDHVLEDERFWLVLYPRTIASLRHVWSHPAFDDEPGVEAPAKVKDAVASERWLREFCDMHPNCCDYDHLLDAARGTRDEDYGYKGRIDGEYFTIYGSDAGGAIPPELWDHLETVTGLRNLPRAKYFSCSC